MKEGRHVRDREATAGHRPPVRLRVHSAARLRRFDWAGGKYRCEFRRSIPDRTTGKRFHEAPECDLPAGSMQDIWMGLSPDHSEETVNFVLSKKRLGWFEVRVSAMVPCKSWSKCHKVML